MVATPLSASSRYFPPGTRKYYWVPAIATPASPSRSELDAGTDLTGEVVSGGVAGFMTTSGTVDAPDMDSRFTAKIPGRITADNSSIKLYASDDSDDARTLLVRDTDGFVVILPEGDVTGRKMNVFPVTITANSIDEASEDPGQMSVQFVITSEPEENVTIPA